MALTPLNILTTTTTITGSTEESLILANNISGSVTIFLPDPSLMKGRIMVVTTTTSSVINIVLVNSVSGLVGGLPTQTISTTLLSKMIYISDGINWY